jgi:hypothetical protein
MIQLNELQEPLEPFLSDTDKRHPRSENSVTRRLTQQTEFDIAIARNSNTLSLSRLTNYHGGRRAITAFQGNNCLRHYCFHVDGMRW